MAFDPSAPVLVVDGHDAEMRILRALLRRLRAVNVDDAADGGAALAKMRAKRYGLVIASWDMAPLTASDFLYEMRSDPGLSRIPVVVTGESKSNDVIAAKKAGANSYIVKPFDAQALKVKIDAAFATKAAPLLERPHAPEAPPSQPPAGRTSGRRPEEIRRALHGQPEIAIRSPGKLLDPAVIICPVIAGRVPATVPTFHFEPLSVIAWSPATRPGMIDLAMLRSQCSLTPATASAPRRSRRASTSSACPTRSTSSRATPPRRAFPGTWWRARRS